jgi:ABC-type Fe3+/spermidine/putrescine transport system ATPase subunit
VIRVDNLSKRFDSKAESVTAVDDVCFEVAAGEVVTLLGPSGCGKTTTLRCIAGLERPSAGAISIADASVVDCSANLFVPAHKRHLGMVFQSYAIWPHMTVLENVAYALEGRGLAKSERKQLALEALAIVQLERFADRPAPRLSGGQQQRVAIARALVGKPRALLFDEPLSNLDAKLRAEMRAELSRLHKQIGLTSIYVTHDQAEALAISDWIIVMREGRIIERGRPADIYRRPRHVFTAQFIGNTNFVPGIVESLDNGTVAVSTEHGRLLGSDPARQLAPGARVQLSIRPEDLVVGERHANRLSGVVELAIFAGSAIEAEVRCGPMQLRCQFGRDTALAAGDRLTLSFASEAAVVLPSE